MIEILEKSQLFKGLKSKEIDEIINNFGVLLDFQKDEFVFSKGEKPEYMFILLSGSITVFSEDINGKRELLSTFTEPGVLFAEVYLYLEKENHHFYAISNENTKLFAISKRFFDELIDINNKYAKQIVENYLNILSEKLYFFNKKIRIMSGFSLRQKLARFIIENVDDNLEFESKYNREELADYLGVTRPSVSRELNNMQKENLIEVSRSKYKILNLEELNNYY